MQFTCGMKSNGPKMLFICYTICFMKGIVDGATNPSNVIRTYSGAWTHQSPTYFRQSDSSGKPFHYQTVEVDVATTGLYTFSGKGSRSIYGSLYMNRFNPNDPSAMLVAHADATEEQGPFKLGVDLQTNTKYILVVSTPDLEAVDEFTVILTGPSSVKSVQLRDFSTSAPIRLSTSSASMPTMYAGALASSSPIFFRPNRTDGYYYFQALRVYVYTSGTYRFLSNSSIDTFGYLYNDPMDPSNPKLNVIAFDDDGGGNQQFQIDQYLRSGSIYVLVVTSFAASTQGYFTIAVSGPDTISLTPFTPSSSLTTTRSAAGSYSGTLSASSPVFQRYSQSGLYYYQALRITTATPGTYTLTSSAAFDTYGYMYDEPMDPSVPGQNLITYDDDSGGSQQFRIVANLFSASTYVLVVTSYNPLTTGSFTIRAAGPGSLYMSAFTPSTSRPMPSTPRSTTLPSADYYGSLTSYGLYFYRPSRNDGYYYYEALQITVYSSGIYTFTSSSSMDTYGLLYSGSVDPSYPELNLMASDDDSGGGGQFRISANLAYGNSYVLIVTTFAASTRGSYSIRVSGPQSVSLYSFTPSASRPIRTTTSSYSYNSGSVLKSWEITLIVCGSVIAVVGFISACSYSQKRQARNNRRQNHGGQPMRPMRPNATRPTAPMQPYTIPVHSAYTLTVEDAPPSYEQAIHHLKPQA